MFLEHVNLTVADLDRSIELYSELLDLHVRWRGETTGGAPAAHVGDERCYLALFQATTPSSPGIDYGRVGFNHLGFVVDDLERVRSRLAARGIEPHLEADYEPGKRLYFFDPDGIEVEIVEYAD